MHSRRVTTLLLAVVGALTLASCGAGSEASESGSMKGSVALLIPGTTGDGGFFDQSAAGTRGGAKAVGWQAKVIETGYEPTKWEPAMNDLATGADDLVISGSFAMVEILSQAAVAHPDKKFVLFDAAPSEKICGKCANVYGIQYNYKETGFLAGALAGALELSTGVDRIKNTKVVGVVGGQEIPVIQDYIAGFKAGVKAVAPDVTVLSAYAGAFDDPVKGKAVAQQMIQQHAEILFTAAGSTDKGVFEAAADNNIWSIGNAAAQANKNFAINGVNAVLTSSDTNVQTSIEDALKLAAENKLPVGTSRVFGAKEGTNSIIESALYKKVVPADIREKVSAITKDVIAGKYADVLSAK